MTQQQIRLVQETFAQVRPMADLAATLFYERLFDIAPQVKPMFRTTEMAEQGRKLMTMIATVVAGLSRLDALIPVIEQMGQRHAGYGVKDDHYDIVGEALLWTLARGLGDAFTAEVEEAWTSAYTVLASTMKRGAAQAAAAVA